MRHSDVLLVLGLLFPCLSWLTGIISWIESSRLKKNVSAIYIPFIGPLLISIWLGIYNKPWWTFLLAWVFDLGTVMVVLALFRMRRSRDT